MGPFSRKGRFSYKGKTPKSPRVWADEPPDDMPDRQRALAAWEDRLRGHSRFASPVELEPAFVPFSPHSGAREEGWDSPAQPKAKAVPRTYFHLLFPAELPVSSVQLSNWLGSLRRVRWPLSLEILGAARGILFQLGCGAGDASQVAATLREYFPDAKCQQGADWVRESLDLIGEANEWERYAWHCLGLGLSGPAYYPLRPFEAGAQSRLVPDPFGPALDVLELVTKKMEAEALLESLAGIQILAMPASGDWGESLAALVACFEEGAALQIMPHLAGKLGIANSDLTKPGGTGKGDGTWAVSARVFALYGREPQDGEPTTVQYQTNAKWVQAICGHLAGALVNGTGGANSLAALPGSDDASAMGDVAQRTSRRTGMVIGTGELQCLLHPPTPSLSHQSLQRFDPRRREVPAILTTGGSRLGVVVPSARDREETVLCWPDAYRNRHAYVLGSTRMGKSTLLLNLMAQDMDRGRGFFLIDPHGDLARDVLDRVPLWREKDAVYLDLADTEHPPALGLLQASDDWERQVLVSDLLAILSRVFSSSWGDRLEHLLRMLLMTLVADTVAADGACADDANAGIVGGPRHTKSNHTLRDVLRLLSDDGFRCEVVSRLRDPDLRAFWRREFPGYSASAFGPIYNKLGLLLRSPVVRNIVAQPEARLDFPELIAGRKIVVVNLAQSLIGEDNATFLGAMLVSKIQMTAMHSLREESGKRTATTLYVDEFHNFMVSSFEKILSEAGKAGLSLVMANQYLEQLGGGLQTAVLSNVGALVSFRVSAASGGRLKSEFGNLFAPEELADMDRGRAIVRIGKVSDSFAIATFPPVAPDDMGNVDDTALRVRTRSRERFCRTRNEVEAEINRGTGADMANDWDEKETAPERPKSRQPKRGKAKPHRVAQTSDYIHTKGVEDKDKTAALVTSNVGSKWQDEGENRIDDASKSRAPEPENEVKKAVTRVGEIWPEAQPDKPAEAGTQPSAGDFFFGLPDD